jgi:hypothetical protein
MHVVLLHRGFEGCAYGVRVMREFVTWAWIGVVIIRVRVRPHDTYDSSAYTLVLIFTATTLVAFCNALCHGDGSNNRVTDFGGLNSLRKRAPYARLSFSHSPGGDEDNAPLVPLSFRSCVFTKAFRFERWSKATKLMCHVHPPTITPKNRVLCICTHNRRRVGIVNVRARPWRIIYPTVARYDGGISSVRSLTRCARCHRTCVQWVCF